MISGMYENKIKVKSLLRKTFILISLQLYISLFLHRLNNSVLCTNYTHSRTLNVINFTLQSFHQHSLIKHTKYKQF
jgi:hypothetical protein